MPTLCDVNILLALCFETHVHHQPSLMWLNSQNASAVVVCRMTQLGLFRLLCNPAVMGESVCTQAQAWNIHDQMMRDDRFLFYAEPEGLEKFLRAYTKSGLSAHRVWQNAYLAAFARAAGFELATFDRAFEQFSGLSLINLRVAE